MTTHHTSTSAAGTAEEAVIRHRILLLRINQEYKAGMSQQELYDITRGVWRVHENTREAAEYALSVYQGIVQAVFRIDGWQEAEKADYRTAAYDPDHPRWKFTASSSVPPEVMEAYLHKSVREHLPKGAQNPVRYIDGTAG